MARGKIPNRNTSILERRFIETTLKEAAKSWEANNNRLFNLYKFQTGDIEASQSFQVDGNTLTYEHLLKNRFIDMKRLGGVKKKSYPIHNNMVMGFFNGIIKDLRVGYTEELRASLANELNIEV